MATERPTAESLPREPMARLLAVMAWLRDRQHGCPWDVEQTFRTIAPYTIEEAYEVADAIDRGDLGALKEELGDLLLQVVYHAQMAQETGAFDFTDVEAPGTLPVFVGGALAVGSHCAVFTIRCGRAHVTDCPSPSTGAWGG